MKIKVKIDNKTYVLEYQDVEESIDIDDLTTTDTSNIFGEVVTMPAAINRIGQLKAQAEKTMALAKLEEKIYIGNFTKDLRKQASQNSGKYTIQVGKDSVDVKLTEGGLATAYEADETYIKLRKEFIEAEANVNALTSLYWSMEMKAKNLNNLVSGTTPDEFVESIIEGKINGIILKKD